MIKALIFDNNGVLTDTEGDGLNKMANMFGVELDHFVGVWKSCAEPLDDGGITTDVFLQSVIDSFDKKVEKEALRDLYLTLYDRDDEMHSVVQDLSRRYDVSLLSNFGDSFDTFEKKWRTHETIAPEKTFVSVKLGMRKPQPEIYLHALERLGREPQEAVFIDDREENVEAALNIGMFGIKFENKDQFLSDLEKLENAEK